MNVNLSNLNNVDVKNQYAKTHYMSDNNSKSNVLSKKEMSDNLTIKKNKDTLVLSAQYSNNYTESDLNPILKNYTTIELYNLYNNPDETIRNDAAQEITVRNALGYTVDLDAVINGKLKDMQNSTQYDYFQKNPEWGFFNGGSQACVSCAVASMLSLNGEPTLPTELGADDYGRFMGGEHPWPTNLVDGSNSVYDINTETEAMSKIKEEIGNGRAVVVHVENHWVTVVGVKEGVSLMYAELDDLYIFDPGNSFQGKELCTRSFNDDHRVVTTK